MALNIQKIFHKKNIQELSDPKHSNALVRNLTVRDLTSMGIAAVVGAGIFSTIGNAAAEGGPGVSLLFIFTSIACLCSALCYAKFASNISNAGSAYTYAYIAFGEIVAWIIGWDLLMEYAIGNIAVALSWSDYFTSLLKNLGIHFPEYLSTDYLSAKKVSAQLSFGSGIPENMKENFLAWFNAPEFFGIKIILDVPALAINILITWLVYTGIKESKSTGNILVLIKIIAIILVISVGAFYINPGHWIPFAPNGLSGIFKGTAGVFFAYIGFDAISTTAEECKNPQRDLPKGMIYSLLICTGLYVLVTLVLTGMVRYSELAVGDPLAYVFEKYDLKFMSIIISISAVVAMTSVLLVFQIGQPRILMTMSRDGLLPGIFSRIHPKHKTPSFSTIVTGFIVAVPILFLNHTIVTDLCVIGTLFAFMVVCAGVLVQNKQDASKGFMIPYYNGKFTVPIFFVALTIIFYFNHFHFIHAWNIENLPKILFIIYAIVISILSFKHKLSLIPVIGLSTNLYLMTELGLTNWIRFGIWMVIGLIIYFSYGNRRIVNSE